MSNVLRYFSSMNRMGVAPILAYPGVKAKGLTARDCLLDPRRHADVVEFNLQRFGPDVALPLLDLTVEAEGFGVVAQFDELDAPSIRTPLPLEDLLSASHVSASPRLPMMIEAAKIISREVKGIPKGFFITGPFTMAGEVIGIEELLRGVAMGRPFISELLERCTEASLAYARALDATGIDFLIMAEPTSSLISRAQFEKYSKQFLARVRSAVSKDIILHICGGSGHLLRAVTETGVAGISLDQNVDLSDAVKAVPSDVLVLGNYSPTELFLGNPDRVKFNVRKMLSPVANAKNVVASTGCDIPATAPPENIEAFIDAAKSFVR
jgi:uroporphyrinogen decarboxylase